MVRRRLHAFLPFIAAPDGFHHETLTDWKCKVIFLRTNASARVMFLFQKASAHVCLHLQCHQLASSSWVSKHTDQKGTGKPARLMLSVAGAGFQGAFIGWRCALRRGCGRVASDGTTYCPGESKRFAEHTLNAHYLRSQSWTAIRATRRCRTTTFKMQSGNEN